MVLICYDGSRDARAAVERAAELLGDQPVTILTVWEPFVDVLARTPSGIALSPSFPDLDGIDELSRETARERAEEGTELANRLGLNAQGRIRSQTSTTSNAILAEADELEASAIVMGSRGLTGMKSLLLGSVSHGVLQRADTGVMVVPSPEVAESRRGERHSRPGS